MNDYYHILGVTPTATLDQIKKAYRKKAKLYHPDINKAPDANEQFIHINEAYEYLLNTTGNNSNRAKRAREQAKKQAAYQQQWEQQERQKARQRAQAHARMKYEAYIKSDVYRTTEALNTVVNFFVALLVLFFVIGLPILSYREHGAPAILFSAIIILPTSPIWFAFIVKTISNFSITGLFEKKQATIQSKITNILILFFVNLVIFLEITLNTHIKLPWIIGLYALSITLGFFASIFTRRNYYKYLIRFIWSPGILSLFFLLNYLFTSNTIHQSFWFSYDYNSSPLYTVIVLENNTYEKYTGLRLFFIKEKLHGKSCITYNTGNGLFGIKVSKDINFYSEYQQQ